MENLVFFLFLSLYTFFRGKKDVLNRIVCLSFDVIILFFSMKKNHFKRIF